MLQHVLGLLIHPRRQWRYLSSGSGDSLAETIIGYLLLLAIIPPLSLLIGVSLFGWQSLSGNLISISFRSAVPLALVLYLMLLTSVVLIAFIMHRLETYLGGNTEFERCLVFTIFTALPLLISGVVGLIPIVWLDIVLVCIAGIFSTRLLITGMPVFLDTASGRKPILASVVLFSGFVILALNSMIVLSLWQLS